MTVSFLARTLSSTKWDSSK